MFATVPGAGMFGWRDKLLGGCSGVVSNSSRTMLLYHDRHLLAISDFTRTHVRHVLLIGAYTMTSPEQLNEEDKQYYFWGNHSSVLWGGLLNVVTKISRFLCGGGTDPLLPTPTSTNGHHGRTPTTLNRD